MECAGIRTREQHQTRPLADFWCVGVGDACGWCALGAAALPLSRYKCSLMNDRGLCQEYDGTNKPGMRYRSNKLELLLRSLLLAVVVVAEADDDARWAVEASIESHTKVRHNNTRRGHLWLRILGKWVVSMGLEIALSTQRFRPIGEWISPHKTHSFGTDGRAPTRSSCLRLHLPSLPLVHCVCTPKEKSSARPHS